MNENRIREIISIMFYDECAKEDFIHTLIANNIYELEGYFNENEQYLITAVFKNYRYEPYYHENILYHRIEDKIFSEEYDFRFDVDVDKLFSKLKKLNDFQSFLVIFLSKLASENSNEYYTEWFTHIDDSYY